MDMKQNFTTVITAVMQNCITVDNLYLSKDKLIFNENDYKEVMSESTINFGKKNQI